MSLASCYTALGGDYEGVVARLRSEKLVQKFVLKFPNDGSYALLCASLEKRDQEEAFRAAHTLKGVCQNLNFTRLYQSSSRLTDLLRGGWDEEALELMKQVTEDYNVTVDAICAFQAEVEAAEG
jgi:HPt (histidine-containing phosphotransfer) domain-containing protein